MLRLPNRGPMAMQSTTFLPLRIGPELRQRSKYTLHDIVYSKIEIPAPQAKKIFDITLCTVVRA